MNRAVAPLVGLFLLLLTAAPAPGQVLVGFNQAWIEGKYDHDLSRGFDPADWRRVFRRAREAGGQAVRVWLFEGRPKEGIVWDGTRPVGVDPVFLTHVREVIGIARAERVRIYWTAISANWPDHWPRGTVDSHRQYNVFANRYGHGDAFRERVLGPVLDAIGEHPDAVYALDLMNEVQGSVRTWFWSDGWYGARRFIRTTVAFVHARCPGLRVTVSSGHHTAATDILAGRLDGLGLDFYDVHVYDDRRIPHGAALVAHARRQGVPIVLGELGQSREAADPAHQARVTRALLEEAARLGFAAVFPWRLEEAPGARFTFFDGDRPRPALDEVRRFAARQRPAAPGRSAGVCGGLDGGS